MKIAILGAAGYVGSCLCRKFTENNHEVIAIDSGFFGFESLKDLEGEITIVKKDGFNLTHKEMEGVDCFINVAGLSNDPMADYSPSLNIRLNTDLAECSAILCKESGVKKYILASSCSIYDFGTLDQERDVLMNEESSVSPEKNYSLSKYKAEKSVLKLADDTYKVIAIRKGTVCGYSPKMRYDLVTNAFIKDAHKHSKLILHGGGENWRPMIDIDDVCEIYYRCAQSLDVTGIYNAVGYNIRISELGLRVASALKNCGYIVDIECDYNFPKNKMRNYRVSGDKLSSSIDYYPKMDIEKTTNKILQHIESNEISDFENSIYYNIKWFQKYIQHWIKY